MIKAYIQKPVVNAIQYTKENYSECVDFCRERFMACVQYAIIIETLEGQQIVKYGDYIVKGAKGDIYSCKSDIFEMTYEEVERV